MSSNPLVSIIIPSWNGKYWLQKCLPTLASQTFRDFEVIVVDNGSTDGTADWVSADFPCVQVIRNTQNAGFGCATNQGILVSHSPYVLTLNNDTLVSADWLERLMSVAQNEPRMGMWASKMVFAERPEVINSAGICVDKCGIAWDRLGGDLDQAGDLKPHEVFGPCGGAALYSREMLNEVGQFDEDFFAYHDDVDLAWRARLSGWRCLYVPTAVVHHYHSATMKDSVSGKWRLLGRNKIAMVLKNYPSPQLYQYAPLIFGYDLIMAMYGLITRGETSHIVGRIDGLMQWGLWWRKRLQIQRRRTMSAEEWERIVQPVAPPWAVRRRFRHLTSIGSTDSHA